MDKSPEILWLLRDGKPGHENQVLGLAAALERQGGFRSESVCLPNEEGLSKRFRRLRARFNELPCPRFIISAGHTTHLPLFYAARRTGARSILLMKPSLPAFLFDLCLVPAHDLPQGATSTPRRLVTRGALNRVRYEPSAKDGRGLILVGGPSREHGWDTATVVNSLEKILDVDPKRRWVLTTSRRTPDDFLGIARSRLPTGVDFHDAAETPTGWLPGQLTKAEIAWVSRDSVSMVYEALSAGARVGLLDVPLRRSPGKLTRGLEELVRYGYATNWKKWNETRELPQPPEPLAEADRCSAEILKRFRDDRRTGS